MTTGLPQKAKVNILRLCIGSIQKQDCLPRCVMTTDTVIIDIICIDHLKQRTKLN